MWKLSSVVTDGNKASVFFKTETLKRFIPVTDGGWTPDDWTAGDGTLVDWALV